MSFITKYKKMRKSADREDSSLSDQLDEFYERFNRENTSNLVSHPCENEPPFLVTNQATKRALTRLNINKAAGPDKIKPQLLKTCSNQLALILTLSSVKQQEDKSKARRQEGGPTRGSTERMTFPVSAREHHEEGKAACSSVLWPVFSGMNVCVIANPRRPLKMALIEYPTEDAKRAGGGGRTSHGAVVCRIQDTRRQGATLAA
ncbi:hypothetical protein ElyMa_001377900 [Elysia marginata]|uniref:Uncharacterized protein n=1 Tax=Elysia marginata TaxID=1093978 RepID=A0AAV4IRE1_9GAST|nr:hypothetical protein ElyMa_001377900 [Elysia marginata]